MTSAPWPKHACLPLLALLLSGCGPGAGAGDADARAAREAPQAQCRVVARSLPLPPEVRESSGLAASRRHPGVLWTHNDSGGDPVLFAVDSTGAPLGTVRVTGAENRDWEDVAAGPCPAGECLYVGDVGDNDGDRPEVQVYRVPEPAPGDAAVAAERMALRYPGGPQDAEALFVLPSGELFVATKGTHGPVALYRAPAGFTPGATLTLERVAGLTGDAAGRLDRVTGASASPDGRWVAVRTYTGLHLFRSEDLTGGGTPASERFELAPLEEPQGEAVALRADGTVFLTSEASGRSEPAVLSRLACTLP